MPPHATMSSASTATANAAPWADLLPELCGLVADRLNAMSVLTFPAVCAPWSAAYKQQAPRLRPGAPTMVTSGMDADGHGCTLYDYEAGVFALHDVATGKTFRAEAEGLKGRCWVGGKDDWLVTADDTCGVELLNPVSGARVSLPSFDTIPGIEVANGGGGEFKVRVEREEYSQSLQRVALCRTPVHPEGYLAVAMFRPNLLAFTRFGEESWTALKNPADPEGGVAGYADTIVHEGKVFAVSRNRAVYSWEMSDGETTADPVVVRRPDPSYPFEYKFHLAVSSNGRVLLISMLGHNISLGSRNRQVRRMIFDDQRNFHACDIALQELDSSDGTWRPVSDIGGDRALFLGANYPFYVSVPRGSQKLKANCIYVADMFDADAAVVDLEVTSDRRFSRLNIYPGENDMYQMPIWFRPTAYLDDG